MKRIYSFAAGIALVVCVSGASAYFTAQSQVPDNVIRSGNVAVASVPATSAISAEGLAPGVPVTRAMTVRNTGSLTSDIVVTGAKKMGITAFYDVLEVRVTNGGRVLYDGPMKSLKTEPLTLQAGQAAELRFEITLPASASNTLADSYVRMTLYVDAEQHRS